MDKQKLIFKEPMLNPLLVWFYVISAPGKILHFFILCFLYFFLFHPISAYSQKKIIPDTIRINNREAVLVLFTDIRRSFVFSDVLDPFKRTNPVTIYGAAAGIEFSGRHQYSLGIYTLSKKTEKKLAENSAGITSINQRWTLTFASLAYTYTFYNKHKFQFRIPFEVGFGQGKIRASDNFDNEITLRKGLVVPVQIGFAAEWSATKYFGFKSSVGYRKTINGSIFRRNFDSPYYSFGIALYLSQILKKVREIRKSNRDEKAQD